MNATARITFCLAIAVCLPARAADGDQQSLERALQRFTLPEIPAELKQRLRDYVPNDLKQRREAGNAKSSGEWNNITTREQWDAFRQEKLTLLRKSLGNSFRRDDWQPPQTVDPVELAGTIKGEGYRIDKLIYRSAYGQWITANLYVPMPERAKMPGFVISHAHHTPKEQGELQDMGVLWARAGCYVLVPDHLGHGERRQHPFKSKADYDQEFQVSRQDYYFRYDVNLQLNIVGESLMGCLALDLMSGVTLLHQQPGIDKEKIILLGAVAGGGDPCAVAAALDERIACAAPFNFGGPQPETRYPLPADAETSFNYGGSGGWESTRNLAFSYRDGTLPWVIVGSIAPRRLIYGHEFSWDREHDPVWKRFEKIYAWYEQPDRLSFATGYGTITAKDPPGSHCTHIGKTHRKKIHEALARWFDIQLPGGEESTDRHEAAELRCWTERLQARLKPEPLHQQLKAQFAGLKKPYLKSGGVIAFPVEVTWRSPEAALENIRVQQHVIAYQNRLVPVLLLDPPQSEKGGALLVLTRADKQTFVRQRAAAIAELLARGVSIVLPDLYSSGLTGTGMDYGRRSSNTGRSSTLAMHAHELVGGGLVDQQLADAWNVLKWLGKERDWQLARVALWSDSLVEPNPTDTNYQVPRDDDSRLPRGPDTLPEQVTLKLAALLKSEVIYVRGGIDSLGSCLDQPLVVLPHDAAPYPQSLDHEWPALIESVQLRRDQTVDCQNRLIRSDELAKPDHDPATAAAWIVKQLTAKTK